MRLTKKQILAKGLTIVNDNGIGISQQNTNRVKQSIGKWHLNNGKPLVIDETPIKIDYSRRFIAFDVIPYGAVRMTQSDRWKTDEFHKDENKRQRKAVANYFRFKESLRSQAAQMGYTIGEAIECIFFIPMPDSWSEKKKEKHLGLPCKVKPDTDNVIKAYCDALAQNDSNIWMMQAQKRWAWAGSIVVYF
jgi:Holliday junction resolvase RusA-like endonuclease